MSQRKSAQQRYHDHLRRCPRFECLETRELLSLMPGIIPTAAGDGTASYVGNDGSAISADRSEWAAAALDRAGGDSLESNTDTAVPAVTGIAPAVGPMAGGTSVTISGSGFTGPTAVNFGGAAAASFTVNSDTLITAVSPASSAGLVDLTVVGANGTSKTSAADNFTFVSPSTLVAQENRADFGNLDQHSLQVSYPALGTGNNNMACGPVAATNSLVYLDNAFPGVYGTSLIASAGHDMDNDSAYTAYDDWIYTAGGCLATSSYMNTTKANGTYCDNFTWGLYTYVEQQAPGKTVYSAEQYNASSNWGNAPAPDTPPSWVQSKTPNWDFIYDALTDSSAVGMMLYYKGSGGHFMSIMGITWNTSTNSGTLQYMDPWNGESGATGIHESSSGTVYTDYGGDNGSWINAITVLSPIAPTVTAVSPPTGPASGDTTVTIIGAGFTDATAVNFGTVAATSFTVESDTQITATSPAATPGMMNVTVTTPAGTSAVSAVDSFTYLAAPASTIGGYDPATSSFSLRDSNTSGNADTSFGFGWVPASGSPGLVPLAGDWTGQGYDTVGLYDPSTSEFYLTTSNRTGVAQTCFGFGWVPASGQPALIPLAGDWTGQKSSAGYSIDTIGLYDPSTSFFYLRNSNTAGTADITAGFGAAGMLPVVGGWQGNGTTMIGVMDPTTSQFYLAGSNTTGYAAVSFGYGNPNSGWIPIAGDWTAKGFDTVGLYDPTNGLYYLRNSNTTGMADIVVTFGAANWKPITGAWSAGRQQYMAGGSITTNTPLPSLAGGQGQPVSEATFADGATAGMLAASNVRIPTNRLPQVESDADDYSVIGLDSQSQDDGCNVGSTVDGNGGFTPIWATRRFQLRLRTS